MATTTLNVHGMTCGGCVSSVKRALANLPGVRQTDVSLEKNQASIDYDPAQVSSEQLMAAIRDAGYDVEA
ncbi:MAG: heavy-metal-associated domain-containing protein [Betaproteobacteria bacterium]|nr:heavy-metal-associated domain-containing protein [Betaproteobacteria bacterium]MDE2621670.1 heavy-metal-associated domain-containing protein [Betaproteobacteria bacterium]